MVSLVSRTLLGFIFIQLLRQYLLHFLDFFSINGYVSIQDTFRILLDSTVTLLSWALSKIFFIRRVRQYLAHFQDSSFLIVALVSRAPSGFIFIQLLRQCPAHLQDSFSFDCYVSILGTFKNLFHSKGTLVSRTLLGFIFLDCCVSVSRTFRIHFHSIVTLVSSTPLGFFLIRLLR